MTMWIVDKHQRSETIVAALWALYGTHAEEAFKWLLNGDAPSVGTFTPTPLSSVAKGVAGSGGSAAHR